MGIIIRTPCDYPRRASMRDPGQRYELIFGGGVQVHSLIAAEPLAHAVHDSFRVAFQLRGGIGGLLTDLIGILVVSACIP